MSKEVKSQKHPGGRPTKYDPSFVQKVDEYLDSIRGNDGNFKEGVLPGVEDFAVYLGVDDDTINTWSKAREKDENGNKTKKLKYPEFSAAIKRLKSIQKRQLVNDGLYNKGANSIFAMFLLKANHGMIETQHVDHTTKGEKLPQPTPIYGGKSTESIQ